jgi:hypothetical protein
MAFIGDVGNDLKSIGQADLGHLAHGGVGLLGGARHHLNADSTPIGRVLQGRGFGLAAQFISSFSDELINRRHLSVKYRHRFPLGKRSAEYTKTTKLLQQVFIKLAQTVENKPNPPQIKRQTHKS